MVPLRIERSQFCMEGNLKLCLQSLNIPILSVRSCSNGEQFNRAHVSFSFTFIAHVFSLLIFSSSQSCSEPLLQVLKLPGKLFSLLISSSQSCSEPLIQVLKLPGKLFSLLFSSSQSCSKPLLQVLKLAGKLCQLLFSSFLSCSESLIQVHKKSTIETNLDENVQIVKNFSAKVDKFLPGFII